MKKFNPNDHVCFLPEEYIWVSDKESLKNLKPREGWIVCEYKKSQNDVIYLVATEKNIIDKANEYKNIESYYSENKDFLIQCKSSFILYRNKKTLNKFNKFKKYLSQDSILREIYITHELNLFFQGKNNRLSIMIKIIAKPVQKILLFIWNVLLLGTIQLFFGDFIMFYKNVHKIHLVNREIKSLTFQNRLRNIAFNKVGESNELQCAKDNLKKYEDEIKETSRAFIAIVIAIISLLFSILKK